MSGLPNPFADDDKEQEGPSFSFYSDPLASYQPGGVRGGRGGGRGPAYAGRAGPAQASAGRGPPTQPQPAGPPMMGALQHPNVRPPIPTNWCGTTVPQQPPGYQGPAQGNFHGSWQGQQSGPAYPQHQQQGGWGQGQGQGWCMEQGRGQGRGGRSYGQAYPGPPPPYQAGGAGGPPTQGGWQANQGQTGYPHQQAKLQRTGPDTRFNQGQGQGWQGQGRQGGSSANNAGNGKQHDMARYYKPSFSEDPWAGLMHRLNAAGAAAASATAASAATAPAAQRQSQSAAFAPQRAAASTEAAEPALPKRRSLADVMDDTIQEFNGGT